jgi:hypothetical protein
MFDEQEQAAIAKDLEKNPNCGYSLSLSESCSNSKGEYVCDTLRTLRRVCPGRRPEPLLSRGSQHSAAPQKVFDEEFDGLGSLFGNLDNMPGIRFAEDMLRGFLEASGSGLEEVPRQPPVPPHKQLPHHQASNNEGPKIHGKIVGRVEDI